MLSIRVNSKGTSKTYTEELVNLTYLVTNNEGAPLSASVPKLTASAKFITYDEFLAGVAKGDILEVWNPDATDGLTLYLHVIEVSALERKGQVEISCTGDFLTDENEIVGHMKVPASVPENLKQLFNLDVLDHYEENPEFDVTVKAKADLIMGLAWAYDTRRNVTLTPFTTRVKGHFNKSGVAMFPNVQEHISSHEYAPVYRVKAEDIIDYTISPAQPPVTHLNGATSPLAEGPNFALNPIEVPVGQVSGSIGSYTGCYNRAASFGAIVPGICHEKTNYYAFQEREMKIYWTTGKVTEVTGIALLGVTTKGYVLLRKYWANSAYYEVAYIGMDGAKIDSLLVEIEVFSDARCFQGKIIEELYLEGDNGEGATVCYFPAANVFDTDEDDKGFTVGVKIYDTGKLEMITVYGSISSHVRNGRDGLAHLAGVSKVNFVGAYGPGAAAVYYTDDYFYSWNLCSIQVTTGITPHTTVDDLPMICLEADDPEFCFSEQRLTPMTFLATNSVPTDEAPHYLIGSMYFYEQDGGALVFIVRIGSGGKMEFCSLEQGDYYQAIGVTPSGQVFAGLDSSYVLTFADPRFFSSPATWGLWKIKLTETDYGPRASYTVVQSGLMSEYLGQAVDTDRSTLSPGLLVYQTGYQDTAQILCLLGTVPFMQMKAGRALEGQKIADGAVNQLSLPFKIGMITQTDIVDVDEDLGRIEIEVASFYVRDNTTDLWEKVDVQDLNVPAIGAYVRVWLDEESEHITMKVLSYNLNYNGVVKLTLTGMIVPDFEVPADAYREVLTYQDIEPGRYIIAESTSTASKCYALTYYRYMTSQLGDNYKEFGYNTDEQGRYVFLTAETAKAEIMLNVTERADKYIMVTMITTEGYYLSYEPSWGLWLSREPYYWRLQKHNNDIAICTWQDTTLRLVWARDAELKIYYFAVITPTSTSRYPQFHRLTY
nr:MAG TPA: hypothetical protein [Caudoviricetes sp.]